MIRPLRRRHRLIIPALVAALIVAGVLFAMNPAPAVRIDTLPAALLPQPVNTP